MELIVTFNIIKYCSRDIAQFYSPKCGDKKGDKKKVVKNILLVASAFFQEHFRSLTWRDKKRKEQRIFILEILDTKVLFYQEKKCISSMLKEALIN